MRKHNFNAGPSVLPYEVLEEAQRQLVDHHGLGLSVMEMSHRSPEFEAILAHAKATLTRLMGIPDTHEILFLQGGASLQFAWVPLNLGSGGAYITTGVWSQKALEEARTVGEASEIWSAKEGGFKEVPAPDARLELPAGAPYVHMTSNNTIYGTQFHHLPEVAAPLVSDMSSDFLSRPVDVKRHELIYAGAQKNAGPSGVTIVVGRKETLRSYKGAKTTPKFLRYVTHAEADSLYNTPPTFGIYLCSLVFDWIERQGGLAGMQKINEEKARRIYAAIDGRPELFRGHARKEARSLMNVPFTMATPEQEKRFLKEAEAAGCIGLKGHRSVGGLRASTYNALPLASVDVLTGLMRDFKA